MKRINIGFYDEIFEKLEARTQAKTAGSIAQSVRELVDLGLKVEDVANQKTKSKDQDPLEFINHMLKNNIRLTIESLLICRKLFSKNQSKGNVDTASELKECKDKALGLIEKMYPINGEI